MNDTFSLVLGCIGSFLIGSVVHMPEQTAQANPILAFLMIAGGVTMIVLALSCGDAE